MFRYWTNIRKSFQDAVTANDIGTIFSAAIVITRTIFLKHSDIPQHILKYGLHSKYLQCIDIIKTIFALHWENTKNCCTFLSNIQAQIRKCKHPMLRQYFISLQSLFDKMQQILIKIQPVHSIFDYYRFGNSKCHCLRTNFYSKSQRIFIYRQYRYIYYFFKDRKICCVKTKQMLWETRCEFYRKSSITILNSFLQIFPNERIICFKIREVEKKKDIVIRKRRIEIFLKWV